MIESTIKQLESDIEEISLNSTHSIDEMEGFAWSIRECAKEIEDTIRARENPEEPEMGISL